MTRRGACTLLAAAAAGFVVYGSLVPFHFRGRPKGDALPAFRWCLENRAWPESRSDAVGNVLIAVPLGFALVGALRAGRPGVGGTLAAGGAATAAAVGLAAAVEFAQLFVPERTCAGSDVYAQGLGAAVGAAGWLLAGERLSRWAAEVVKHPRAGGAAGRWLAGYLAVVGGVQLQPFDLTASPADVYRKVRDGRVVFLPFAEPADPAAVRKWLTLAGLFLPAGVLAARVRPLPAGWAVAGGFAWAGLTECGQLLVSRQPSVTDVLVGGAGAAVGTGVGRVLRGRA